MISSKCLSAERALSFPHHTLPCEEVSLSPQFISPNHMTLILSSIHSHFRAPKHWLFVKASQCVWEIHNVCFGTDCINAPVVSILCPDSKCSDVTLSVHSWPEDKAFTPYQGWMGEAKENLEDFESRELSYRITCGTCILFFFNLVVLPLHVTVSCSNRLQCVTINRFIVYTKPWSFLNLQIMIFLLSPNHDCLFFPSLKCVHLRTNSWLHWVIKKTNKKNRQEHTFPKQEIILLLCKLEKEIKFNQRKHEVRHCWVAGVVKISRDHYDCSVAFVAW